MIYEEDVWTRTFIPRVQDSFISWAENDLILLTLSYARELRLTPSRVPNQAGMEYAILARGNIRNENLDYLVIDTLPEFLQSEESYKRRVRLSHPIQIIPKDITAILERGGFTQLNVPV